MAGFDNDVVYGTNVDFTGTSPVSGQITLDGELLIGAAVAPFIRSGLLTGSGGITITNGPGTIDIDGSGVAASTTFRTDVGNAIPAGGLLFIVGGSGVSTSGAGNTITITNSIYSTGTYLPVAKGSGGDPTVTYANQDGSWTRIGNLVFVTMFINWNGGDYVGGGGDAQFTLPFTSANFADSSQLQMINGSNGAGQFAPYFLSVSPNTNVGTVSNGGGFVGVGTQAGIGSNTFTGCYQAS